MKLYHAEYKSDSPWGKGEATKTLYDREQAIRWLLSFATGIYTECTINGESVDIKTERANLKATREEQARKEA